MPLQVTPVNRNLQTRVTFMLLEMEDLFIVLGAAAVMNVLGHFVGGEIAGMPTNIVLQYGVPLLMVPVLMAFKYGKPRGYVRDLAFWYMKPHAYCARGTRPRNPVGVSEGGIAVPLTLEQHERKLHDPALCEQLPVRDYLDNIVVRTNGAFVAGYELKGLASYFASDEGRDRGKLMLEALLRSLPEQSMRVQFRYEVVEDLGDLLEQLWRSPAIGTGRGNCTRRGARRTMANERGERPLHAASLTRVLHLGSGRSSPYCR